MYLKNNTNHTKYVCIHIRSHTFTQQSTMYILVKHITNPTNAINTEKQASILLYNIWVL